MPRNRRKKSLFANPKIRYLLAALVLAVGMLAALELSNKTDLVNLRDDNPKTSPEDQQPNDEQPDNTPPTNSPNPAADIKDDPPVSNPASSSQKNKVTPLIFDARQNNPGDPVLVKATVPGVFEEGGKCTASLTKGGVTVSSSVVAFGNFSETNCPQISIPRSKLSAGTWYVTVSYSSSKSEGKSAQQTVEVR